MGSSFYEKGIADDVIRLQTTLPVWHLPNRWMMVVLAVA